MKKAFLLLAIISNLGFCFDAIINTASANLAQVYSTSAPSLQTTLKNLYLRDKPTLMMSNPTACRICTNTVSSSLIAPTAGNGNEHCLPPNSIGFFDIINISRGPASVYVRTDQAQCSSGTIDLDIW